MKIGDHVRVSALAAQFMTNNSIPVFSTRTQENRIIGRAEGGLAGFITKTGEIYQEVLFENGLFGSVNTLHIETIADANQQQLIK